MSSAAEVSSNATFVSTSGTACPRETAPPTAAASAAGPSSNSWFPSATTSYPSARMRPRSGLLVVNATAASVPWLKSPEETTRLSPPRWVAAVRCAPMIVARRATPPTSEPSPAVVGSGQSSPSFPNANRCECSSVVKRRVSRLGRVASWSSCLQPTTATAVSATSAARRNVRIGASGGRGDVCVETPCPRGVTGEAYPTWGPASGGPARPPARAGLRPPAYGDVAEVIVKPAWASTPSPTVTAAGWAGLVAKETPAGPTTSTV